MASFSALLEQFFYHPDEEVGGLFGLPAVAEADRQPPAEEPFEEFLSFWLEDECYAVPIREVREIVRVPLLTEVPRAPVNLLGVINLRGEVLPVYDLKIRLKLANEPPRIAGPDADLGRLLKSSRVVVLRSDEGDAGVLVDRVADVFRQQASKIEAPPPGLAERDGVVGLGRNGNQFFILLNPEQALS